jgi:hypothetical protein
LDPQLHLTLFHFSFTEGYNCFVAIFDEEQMQFIHAVRIVSDGYDLGVTALAADNQDNLIVCGSYDADNIYIRGFGF